jgi:hypothetical protein
LWRFVEAIIDRGWVRARKGLLMPAQEAFCGLN